MRQMMEPLEARQMMSVVPSATVQADLQKLATDVATAQAQFAQYLPTVSADFGRLRADMLATHSTANRVLLAREHAAGAAFLAMTRAGTFALLRTESAVAHRITNDGLLAAAHPLNPFLQARLALDQATFNTAAGILSTRLGTISATLGAAASGAYQAILAANPNNAAIAADIQQSESDGSAFFGAMATDMSNVATDLTTLVQDVVSGA